MIHQVDYLVRNKAFELLVELTDRYSEILPFKELSNGFLFNDVRVPLLGPQGIFKPKVLELPLSITTAPNGPYDDAFGSDGLLRYRYRGTDPQHRDNVGLREIMGRGLPLIYLHGIVKGKYVAAWPVYIVSDNPGNYTFTVAVDDKQKLMSQEMEEATQTSTELRRKYITSTTRVRLHQTAFRERVLAAYQKQCALCNLRHIELLEAAHIIPDADPEGEPIVSNGISLCKLHHAAFDGQILGIRPDYVVELRLDILEEHDGPMLRYGLQEMHGRKLHVPRNKIQRPDKEALERRYDQFISE